MDGYKTWIAVVVSLAYGIGFEGIYNNNWAAAMTYILAALSLLGIGGKLTKINRRF